MLVGVCTSGCNMKTLKFAHLKKKIVCMRFVIWTAVTTMNIFRESVSVTKNLAWRTKLIFKRLPHKYLPFMTVPRPKQLLDHPSRQRLQFVQSIAHWDMSQQVWLWNKFFCNRSGFLPSVSFQKHFTISFILTVVLSEGQAGDCWLTKQRNVPFRIRELWTERYMVIKKSLCTWRLQ
jgi:hypothetical protein